MLAQTCARMRAGEASRAKAERGGELLQTPADRIVPAPLDGRERAQPLGPVGHDPLGRPRGRRTLVGDEIDDSEIRLVTDAAHDRDRAGVHGARHGLVVEGLQILERAAAACQDQHVAVRAPGEAQRIDDLAGCKHALHATG
jgi:hypothetical protein